MRGQVETVRVLSKGSRDVTWGLQHKLAYGPPAVRAAAITALPYAVPSPP